MKFEVEHKEYIKVNVDDVDVLLGAIKILKKRLSKDLQQYDSFYYRDKKIICGYEESYGAHSGFVKDILIEKFPKVSDRDIGLIKTMISLANESCQNSTDRVLDYSE